MINLKQVTVDDKNLLWNVLQKYLYEMTQFYPDDVMDEQGNYSYKYFDAYFTEPNRKAYFIYLDDDFIGFAMINSNSYIDQHPDYVLAEYTIFPGYRGLGNFAFNAAQEIFGELPGKWELKFLETNEVAKKLWLRLTTDYRRKIHHLPDNETVIEFEVDPLPEGNL